MYQCILNLPQLNDWSKVTYSQVNGSPVLKALSFKRLSWISVTKFAELIQFAQNPKFRRPWTFSRENLVFHWRKKDFIFQFHLYFSANFAFYFLVSYIYIWLTISSCYGSIPLTLGLIVRDGGLSTLVSCLQVCLSVEGSKYVSCPWLSPLWGWDSLTMALTGKFVYIYIDLIL